MLADLPCFPAGDGEAPPSIHIERSAGCARVRYTPTVQQQNSVSSKGLNADFIIQYDVDLKDLMGDVQVSNTFSFLVHSFSNTLECTCMCVDTVLKAAQ